MGGLQEACGYEYTLKLHRMFNDMQTSRDLNTEYRNQVERSGAAEDGTEGPAPACAAHAPRRVAAPLMRARVRMGKATVGERGAAAQ